MKKLIFLVAFLICAVSLKAQSDYWKYNKLLNCWEYYDDGVKEKTARWNDLLQQYDINETNNVGTGSIKWNDLLKQYDVYEPNKSSKGSIKWNDLLNQYDIYDPDKLVRGNMKWNDLLKQHDIYDPDKLGKGSIRWNELLKQYEVHDVDDMNIIPPIWEIPTDNIIEEYDLDYIPDIE